MEWCGVDEQAGTMAEEGGGDTHGTCRSKIKARSMAHWKINTKSLPAPAAFGPTRPPAQAEFSDLSVDTIYSFELEVSSLPIAHSNCDKSIGPDLGSRRATTTHYPLPITHRTLHLLPRISSCPPPPLSLLYSTVCCRRALPD